MNKKAASILSVLIIVIFIGYIIFDTASPGVKDISVNPEDIETTDIDKWVVSKIFDPEAGPLKAIAVSSLKSIFLAGDSWIACYDENLKLLWNLKTTKPVTALSISGDTLYASTIETILIISSGGEIKDEWGPFEDNAIITSITSNRSFVAFADAGNKIVVVLNKKGDLRTLIGKTGEQFVVPSPYFDVTLNEEKTLYIANTGNRRIETRKTDGTLVSYFGQPGTAPDAFCGCCNPAHFAVIPGGFVTAEKGLNRIKILNENGEFLEYVSSKNDFIASVPLDVASFDGKTIYAANPADGKLYIFKRK